MNNSIVVGNKRADATADDSINAFAVSAHNNIFGVDRIGAFTDGQNGNHVNAIASDIFASGLLADNGGPSFSIALKRNSIAIDAGSTALAVDSAGAPLTVDQRHFPRISGAAVDAGAIEFQLSITVTANVVQLNVNYVTVGGNVFAEADAGITERGFLFSLSSVNPNPTLGGAGVTVQSVDGRAGAMVGGGAFPAANYSFVGYATTRGGTVYSSVGNFAPYPEVGQLPGVTVQVLGRQLIITVDNLADNIRIQGDGVEHEYAITAFNGTTVNGVVNGTVTAGLVENMLLKLTAGADVYSLDNANLPGDIVIGGGSGNKTITLGTSGQPIIVGGNVSVNGGTGNDTIYVNQTYVTGSLTIIGGSGGSSNRITTAFSAIHGDLTITGAAGYDLVQQTQVSIGGVWTIDVGAGNDLISAAQCAATGNATFSSGTGIDTIAIAGVDLKSAATFDGSRGGGNKTLTLYSSILGATAYMIGGTGDDSISFDNNVATGLVFGGSQGKDVMAVRTSILDSLFANLDAGDDTLEIRYTHVRQNAQANGGAGYDILRNVGNLFDSPLRQKNFEKIDAS